MIALHCMPHAVGNFIMRLSVSSDQESASGQAGVAAATAAGAAAGGGSPRVAFAAGPRRVAALNQSSATNAKNTNNFN